MSKSLLGLLRKGVLLTLLGEGSLLLGCVGLGQADSIVVTVENGVELSHEYITDEEHFLLDVHLHDGGGTHLLGWSVAAAAQATRVCLPVLELYLLAVHLSLGLHVLWLDLCEDLRTEWAHLEFHLLSTLGEVELLWVEHPLIRCQGVLFSADDEGKITKLSLTLALNEGVSGWYFLLSHGVECECWY